MTTSSVIGKAYGLVADKRLIIAKDVDFAKNKIQSLFHSCGYEDVLTSLNYYINIIEVILLFDLLNCFYYSLVFIY